MCYQGYRIKNINALMGSFSSDSKLISGKQFVVYVKQIEILSDFTINYLKFQAQKTEENTKFTSLRSS